MATHRGRYPNNALLLAAHDGNLTRIREDIATMEAADRLLKDASRPLPQHRRDTLESIRAASEKNATTGIQNKFTHLFSAGNSQQHQWPELHSHLEQRTLESLTDAAGKGQDVILQALGDRVLRSGAAGLSKTAWARVGIITSEQGSTLGELRDYFARTPDARIIINDATWRAVIANGVSNDALHVVTPSDEMNPTGYDASWRVWVKGHEPQPQAGASDTGDDRKASGGTETGGTSGGNSSGRLGGAKPRSPAANYPARPPTKPSNGSWPTTATTGPRWPPAKSTEPARRWPTRLPASRKATTAASSSRCGHRTRGYKLVSTARPQRVQGLLRASKRMMNKAGVSTADVSVRLEPDAAQRVLEKLNNRDEANISVSFH